MLVATLAVKTSCVSRLIWNEMFNSSYYWHRLAQYHFLSNLTEGRILDAICGLAKGSPMTTPRAERLPSSNSDDDCHEEQLPTSTCILPAVLRDRPHTGRGGRGAPPPVPPRSPRRPHDSRETSLSRGGIHWMVD